MKKYGYIYSLTCLVNLKEYIGQTISYKSRWKAHVKDSVACVSGMVIHRAMRQHGVHNFAGTVLRRCLVEDLDYWEQYYIDKFDTMLPYGYNMTEGGYEGSRHSSVGRKIGDAHRGMKRSVRTRERISEAHKGKKLSGRHKANLSLAQRRRFALNPQVWSEERKEAFRASAKIGAAKRWANPDERAKHAIRARAVVGRPEVRAKIANTVKQLWASETYRTKVTEAIRKAKRGGSQ